MSVMACDRGDCKNIMCNRLILNGTMYICSSCYQELLLYKEEWPEQMSLYELENRIKQFMNTNVNQFFLLSKEEIESEFKKLVGNYI